MITKERQITIILTELYNRICTCIRNDEGQPDLLNPAFHVPKCLYKIAVENETEIEWKKQEEPTQES